MKKRLMAAVVMTAFCLSAVPAWAFVDPTGKYTTNPTPDLTPNVNKPGSGGGSFSGGGGGRTPDIVRPDLGGGSGPVQGIPTMPLPPSGGGSGGASGSVGGVGGVGGGASVGGAGSNKDGDKAKDGDKGGGGAAAQLPGGSGGGSGGGTPEQQAYLAALREWGKRWADYFKSLAEREQVVQTSLTKDLASCVFLWGASELGRECSDRAISDAEKKKADIEKLRQEGIARAAKEKAAIEKMKPGAVPSVPLPIGGVGAGAGTAGGIGGSVGGAGVGSGGGTSTTTTTTTTTTTSNNTTTTNNVTHNNTTNNNTTVVNQFEDKNDVEEFCKKNPEALSCLNLKGAKFDDKNEDVKEEKPSKDLSKFKVTGYFSGGGVCPADVSVNVGIFGTFALSYQWFCRLAALLRPLVIAFSWLSALLIIVKGSKGSE